MRYECVRECVQTTMMKLYCRCNKELHSTIPQYYIRNNPCKDDPNATAVARFRSDVQNAQSPTLPPDSKPRAHATSNSSAMNPITN